MLYLKKFEQFKCTSEEYPQNNYQVGNRHSTVETPWCLGVGALATQSQIPQIPNFRSGTKFPGSSGKRCNIRNDKLCTSLVRRIRIPPSTTSRNIHFKTFNPGRLSRWGETGCTQLLRLLGSFITLTKRSPYHWLSRSSPLGSPDLVLTPVPHAVPFVSC